MRTKLMLREIYMFLERGELYEREDMAWWISEQKSFAAEIEMHL